MREDTNFKGSDLSCPSIYYLLYDLGALKFTTRVPSKRTFQLSLYLFFQIAVNSTTVSVTGCAGIEV
jgi:hypothetical protein